VHSACSSSLRLHVCQVYSRACFQGGEAVHICELPAACPRTVHEKPDLCRSSPPPTASCSQATQLPNQAAWLLRLLLQELQSLRMHIRRDQFRDIYDRLSSFSALTSLHLTLHASLLPSSLLHAQLCQLSSTLQVGFASMMLVLFIVEATSRSVLLVLGTCIASAPGCLSCQGQYKPVPILPHRVQFANRAVWRFDLKNPRAGQTRRGPG
jgi:hypothetical protein